MWSVLRSSDRESSEQDMMRARERSCLMSFATSVAGRRNDLCQK